MDLAAKIDRRRAVAASRLFAPFYLGVFAVGVPVIVISRVLFAAADPDYVARWTPTISKTASAAPAYAVFAVGMTVVAAFILVLWPLTWRMYRERLAGLGLPAARRRLLSRSNDAALALGVTAGVALGLLAVFGLHISNPLHMALSYVFYPAQIVAFLFETVVSRAVVPRGPHRGPESMFVGAKTWLCAVIVLTALIFLFMFIAKDAAVFADDRTVQRIYVASEYATAVMCLAYPALIYPLYRSHLRQRAVRGAP